MKQSKNRIGNENGNLPNGKVMLAWSNGMETHLHPSMMHLAEQEHIERLELYKCQSKKPSSGQEHYCRCISREYERYSDELWEMGLHVEAYRVLLYSATVLLEVHRCWIDRRCTSWYHSNLVRFRHLFRRCRERATQDARLVPLFNASEVKRTYGRMLDEYAECNISDRIRVKDWDLWDDIWQWDGDDPLCD